MTSTRREPPENTVSTEPSEDSRHPRPPAPALVVVLTGASPGAGVRIVPLAGLVRIDIGRDDGGAIEVTRASGEQGVVRLGLPDPKISSRHASVQVRGGHGHRPTLSVSDHGSKNGTWIEEARVSPGVPRELLARTPLVVGSTLLALLPDATSASGPEAKEAWPFRTTNVAFARELEKLGLLAATSLPVLLLGETGVGKEVVARALHERGGRPGPFLAVNCGAIPTTLVEAQLFGHRKGAFSGATDDAPGFFRAAHRGTLFLDEVGDLPLAAQPALLRALQEGDITPVGSATSHKVDVRVLAATHVPLDQLVAEGRFRADLYARLRGYVTTLPPLRERPEDLGWLVARIAETQRLDLALAGDAVRQLYQRRWPMNVRELSHALVTASHLARGASGRSFIRAEHLPLEDEAHLRGAPVARDRPERPLDDDDLAIRDEVARRLRESGGNVSQVAREMGKARQQIQRWMRRFQLG